MDMFPHTRKSCVPLQGVPCVLRSMLETVCLSCQSLSSNKDPKEPLAHHHVKLVSPWPLTLNSVPNSTSTPEGHLSYPPHPVLSEQKHMAPHMANPNSLLSQEGPPIGPCRFPGQRNVHFLEFYCKRKPHATVSRRQTGLVA